MYFNKGHTSKNNSVTTDTSLHSLASNLQIIFNRVHSFRVVKREVAGNDIGGEFAESRHIVFNPANSFSKLFGKPFIQSRAVFVAEMAN